MGGGTAVVVVGLVEVVVVEDPKVLPTNAGVAGLGAPLVTLIALRTLALLATRALSLNFSKLELSTTYAPALLATDAVRTMEIGCRVAINVEVLLLLESRLGLASRWSSISSSSREEDTPRRLESGLGVRTMTGTGGISVGKVDGLISWMVRYPSYGFSPLYILPSSSSSASSSPSSSS
jgi:hypothetical protein